MKVFLLDVDGVMTDGQFHYSSDGKVMKIFGPDDSDALALLDPFLEIQFVSADHRGFEISKARIVNDMKRPLELVSSENRLPLIKERWDPATVIYMGDGIFDHYIFKSVGYSIAPENGDGYTKSCANYVTKRKGGDRAVSEASLHILNKFFEPYIPD